MGIAVDFFTRGGEAAQACSPRCKREVDSGLHSPALCCNKTLTRTHEFASGQGNLGAIFQFSPGHVPRVRARPIDSRATAQHCWSGGRRTPIGVRRHESFRPTGGVRLNLEDSNSGGTLAYDFPEPDCWEPASAAEAIPLPKAKPRTLREHFVVPSIRSRKIARAQRSNVRHREDALKAFDFGNSLLGVHSVPISNLRVAMIKPSGICAFPQWPVGAIPTGRVTP